MFKTNGDPLSLFIFIDLMNLIQSIRNEKGVYLSNSPRVEFLLYCIAKFFKNFVQTPKLFLNITAAFHSPLLNLPITDENLTRREIQVGEDLHIHLCVHEILANFSDLRRQCG